jgi:hypothetical protein
VHAYYRDERSERGKGAATRVHEAVNRTLATIAMILSIVALIVVIRLGLKVDGLVGNITNIGNTLGNLVP